MTARRFVTALACVLALSAAAAAQNRGKAKAEGKVLNEQGQPLQDVIVAAVMEGFDKPFQQAKTNNKGEWKIENLAAGKWKFVFGGKQDLEEKVVDVQISDGGTIAVPAVKLGKPVDHNALISAELQRAAQLLQNKQAAEARKIYESILAKYPDMQAPFTAQLHGAIAQTYGADNQMPEAIEHLKKAIALDAQNTEIGRASCRERV